MKSIYIILHVICEIARVHFFCCLCNYIIRVDHAVATSVLPWQIPFQSAIYSCNIAKLCYYHSYMTGIVLYAAAPLNHKHGVTVVSVASLCQGLCIIKL